MQPHDTQKEAENAEDVAQEKDEEEEQEEEEEEKQEEEEEEEEEEGHLLLLKLLLVLLGQVLDDSLMGLHQQRVLFIPPAVQQIPLPGQGLVPAPHHTPLLVLIIYPTIMYVYVWYWYSARCTLCVLLIVGGGGGGLGGEPAGPEGGGVKVCEPKRKAPGEF